MEIQLVDLTSLLLSLSIILCCWVILIKLYPKIQNTNTKGFENNLRNSFVIGIGSGLIVFVSGFIAQKISLNKIDISSIDGFAISTFAMLVNLILQLSITLALIMWIIYFTFNNLSK